MQPTKMSTALAFSEYVVAFYQRDKMYYIVDLSRSRLKSLMVSKTKPTNEIHRQPALNSVKIALIKSENYWLIPLRRLCFWIITKNPHWLQERDRWRMQTLTGPSPRFASGDILVKQKFIILRAFSTRFFAKLLKIYLPNQFLRVVF